MINQLTKNELQQKSDKELKDLLEWYEEKHKQARKAYYSDNVGIWDEKMKEYMEKIDKIKQEIIKRHTNE
jgi:hypothetical protein